MRRNSAGVVCLLGLIASGWAEPAPPRLSPAVYEALTRSQSLRQEERLEEATACLRGELERPRIPPYERALLGHSLGFLLMEQERSEQAVETWHQCLAEEALPETIAQATRFALSQTLLGLARHKESLDLLEVWLQGVPSPTPEVLVQKASLQAELGSIEPAITSLERALGAASQPREEWLTFLAGLHQESGDIEAVSRTLERRLLLFPENPEAWVQLAGSLQSLDRNDQGLAILELGRLQGALDRPQDHLRLARWRLHLGLAYEARRQLEEDIQTGRVPRTPEAEKLLEAMQGATLEE